MDDALPGLVDIEHRDAAGRCFGPQTRQQFLPDLAGPGAAPRRRNRVVRRRECQLRIVDTEVAAFEIEQASRPAEIVQQMTIDVQQIRIAADRGNDMLVPDLGQQRSACLFQQHILPFGFCGQRRYPLPAVSHGLIFKGIVGPRL